MFHIQRFAVHDGPGIRTTVFLKGCNNRCGWCHNPESLSRGVQLAYYPDRCVGCGACVGACPEGAHTFEGERHALNRDLCTRCGACAAVCNTQALVMMGREMSVEEIMRQVMADAVYYRTSGGGMTLSGGEPVLQPDFARELLQAAKREGLHTCMETAGNYPPVRIEPMLPYLDLLLFDLKAMNPGIYVEHIRGDRARMLAALEYLAGRAAKLIVRTPVVEPVNSTDEEIEAIAKHVGALPGIEHYVLIPYHALGKAKYDALGEEYDTPYRAPTKERMLALERLAARHVRVYNKDRGFVTSD